MAATNSIVIRHHATIGKSGFGHPLGRNLLALVYRRMMYPPISAWTLARQFWRSASMKYGLKFQLVDNGTYQAVK